MKLCIVTHSVIKRDGQGRVNYEIVSEALRRGHHVTLLATRIAPELEQNNQVRWIPIPINGFPTELVRNLVFAWHSSKWLRKHRQELDVVKVNGAITWAASDVNAVHFVHNSWLKFCSQQQQNSEQRRRPLYDFYQWVYTAINARWEKIAFAQAKVVVAVSDRLAKDLLAIGVPPEAVTTIVNGVDLQEFAPGKLDRKNWGLPENVAIALFAGDIRIPRKNLDTVLKALVKVPNLHLAVAGITEGSPYLQLADALGLSDRVHFLGHRMDVPEIMKAVDFLVFPSRYEPFGLVVIEAMASGLPVITARSTGAAELVTAEAGVVLADADDATAMAEALAQVTNNAELRTQMGAAAHAIAQQHSWDKMAHSYVDLFESVVSH